MDDVSRPVVIRMGAVVPDIRTCGRQHRIGDEVTIPRCGPWRVEAGIGQAADLSYVEYRKAAQHRKTPNVSSLSASFRKGVLLIKHDTNAMFARTYVAAQFSRLMEGDVGPEFDDS